MLALLLATTLALADPPAFRAPTQGATAVDLEGDGKPEKVTVGDSELKIGAHTLECYSDDGAGCVVTEVDLTAANKQKDAMLCAAGPRDTPACTLYTLIDGKLKQVAIGTYGSAESVEVNGSGFVYAKNDTLRLFTRVEKYAYADGALTRVPQPLYLAESPVPLRVEKTFPLLLAPAAKEVVGNTRENSDITVVAEHGAQDGWLLVRLSSGIGGWVHADTLRTVSEQYFRMTAAG